VTSLLEAQHVSRVFGSGLLNKGSTLAVDGVSLIINEDKPSITAIAGESGSGQDHPGAPVAGCDTAHRGLDPVPGAVA